MKKMLSIRGALIASVVLGSLFLGLGLTKEQALNKVLFSSVQNWHYDPKPLDNDYSKKVFDLYIERLDPAKRLLTTEDIATLKTFQYDIDDELMKGTRQFYTVSKKLIKARRYQLERYAKARLKKPFNFKRVESFESDSEKYSYAKSEDILREKWRKSLKYQVLTQYKALLVSESNETESKKEEKEKKETNERQKKYSNTIDMKLEKKARKKVLKTLTRSFDRMKKETAEEHYNGYVDSLLNVFDTHTGYFPPQKKEDFDISISGKLEGIGAVLREDDGFIKVVRIVPGSASWRQGDLKAEDIILKVAQKDKEPVDIVGTRVRDAVKLIRGKKGDEVRLTVKKPSGKIMVIPIVRDIVVIEETYAQSALIKDDRTGKTIAYIYIPKFYRDFSDKTGRNTTTDLQNELRKIALTEVDGLILDLRQNEGGALIDAVDVAGLFIEKGPIVQVKVRNEPSTVLKDKDPRIFYDGDMVVLMNHYSASASEILAAALQDYQRAIIVGSSDSFGKGSVQTFINLDNRFAKKSRLFKSLGSLKLTIQKFYRINGGSTQYKGVSPDILLPDNYGYLEIGERYLDHSLPWDTIDPLSFTRWSKKRYNKGRLQQNSQARVEKSESFQSLAIHLKAVKKERDNSLEPLSLIESLKKRDRIEKETERFKKSQINFEHLHFNTLDTKSLSKEDQERQKEFHDRLRKDMYLNEALMIVHDMVAKNTLVKVNDDLN